MGILDSLENSDAFKGALGQIGGAVLPVVLSEVMGNGSQGGLTAIVAKLQQAGLGDQVKSKSSDPAHQSVYVRCDETVPFGSFTTVVDALRQSGIVNVNVVTQPLTERAQTP